MYVGHRFISVAEVKLLARSTVGKGELLHGSIVRVSLSEAENQGLPEISQAEELDVLVPVWSQFVTFGFMKIQLLDSGS